MLGRLIDLCGILAPRAESTAWTAPAATAQGRTRTRRWRLRGGWNGPVSRPRVAFGWPAERPAVRRLDDAPAKESVGLDEAWEERLGVEAIGPACGDLGAFSRAPELIYDVDRLLKQADQVAFCDATSLRNLAKLSTLGPGQRHAPQVVDKRS